MIRDLRFGWRMLWRNPGFTVMAVLALALGIGANTSIFSVVNAVMLQRMPFQDPNGLVMVWESSPQASKTNVVNPVNFREWQKRNHSFERIAALVNYDVSLSGDGEPEVVPATSISNGYFEMLGVKPILGRWFTAQEDTPGNDNVAILSESLWRRRYGADPHVLGRKLRYDAATVTI